MLNKKILTCIAPSSGGKDYFLEILEEELKKHKIGTFNAKFAGMVREVLKEILFLQLIDNKIFSFEEINSLSEYEKEELFDEYKNKHRQYLFFRDKNLRESLQYFNETLKEIDKNIHIAFVFLSFLNIDSKKTPIITDCRFENELKSILLYNKSNNKEEFIQKYIASINFFKDKKNIKPFLKKRFNFELSNKYEDKIFNLLFNKLSNFFNNHKYFSDKNRELETYFLETEINLDSFKTKEDFFKESIILLNRFIIEDKEEIERQKKIYSEQGIDFKDNSFYLSNGKQMYFGSAFVKHISEQLAFSLPEGFLNSTNSSNLKDNLLPIVLKEIFNISVENNNIVKKNINNIKK